MFTGVDLSGWKANDEIKKHWVMKDGILSYDGKNKSDMPLWSESSYGDFELVCDYTTTGDAEIAVLVRGSKKEIAFKDKKAGVWHRSVVQLKGDRASLAIDNEVVAENIEYRTKSPSGPIALVGTGALQFRNVFIRELK